MPISEYHNIDTTKPRKFAKINDTSHKVESIEEVVGTSEPAPQEGYSFVQLFSTAPSVGSLYVEETERFIYPRAYTKILNSTNIVESVFTVSTLSEPDSIEGYTLKEISLLDAKNLQEHKYVSETNTYIAPRKYAKISNSSLLVTEIINHYLQTEPDSIEGYTLVELVPETCWGDVGWSYDSESNSFSPPDESASYLSGAKTERISTLEGEMFSKILESYPIQKQLFLLNQIDSERDTNQLKTELITYLNALRDLKDTYEGQINACATIQDLGNLSFTWEVT